jgi:hypothetical protein
MGIACGTNDEEQKYIKDFAGKICRKETIAKTRT